MQAKRPVASSESKLIISMEKGDELRVDKEPDYDVTDQRMQWARCSADAGISIIPTHPGSLQPYTGWQKAASTSDSTIQNWANEEHPDCNFAYLMGKGFACL